MDHTVLASCTKRLTHNSPQSEEAQRHLGDVSALEEVRRLEDFFVGDAVLSDRRLEPERKEMIMLMNPHWNQAP